MAETAKDLLQEAVQEQDLLKRTMGLMTRVMVWAGKGVHLPTWLSVLTVEIMRIDWRPRREQVQMAWRYLVVFGCHSVSISEENAHNFELTRSRQLRLQLG